MLEAESMRSTWEVCMLLTGEPAFSWSGFGEESSVEEGEVAERVFDTGAEVSGLSSLLIFEAPILSTHFARCSHNKHALQTEQK